MKNGQYGPIAQLGERTVRIRKVVGSIPIGSTKNGNRRGFTTAISRLTTEIPQIGFDFDHLKGTPFRKEYPSFVYCPAKSEVAFLCFTFAVPDFPRP